MHGCCFIGIEFGTLPFFADCRLWPVQLLQFDQSAVHILWESSVRLSGDRQRTSLLWTGGKLNIWTLQPPLSMNLDTATNQCATITLWIPDLSKCLMQFPENSYVQITSRLSYKCHEVAIWMIQSLWKHVSNVSSNLKDPR